MKKILSIILSALLLISSAVTATAWEAYSTDYSPIKRDSNVLARIVIGSDVHIGDVNASPKLENMYDAIGKLGGADAVFLAGDLTDGGRANQFEELMEIVAAGSKSLTVEADGFTMKATGSSVDTTILMMGNHDYYNQGSKAPALFTEKTGQVLDKLYWINGKVPVIKLSMTSSNYKGTYVTKHDFIKASLDEISSKGYTGHIFLVSHMAVSNTMVGSPDPIIEPFAPETIELLKSYPQLIHVTGHSHERLNNPAFIDQSAGFTSITDGVVGEDYSENEYPEAEDYLGSGIVIFDVKSDGTTEFYRVDLENGVVLYENEEWILDSSDKPEDFIYFARNEDAKNPDSYNHKSQAPSFPADAWVKFTSNNDFDSVEVTFTMNAVPASDKNHDYVHRYRIAAEPADGTGTVRSVTTLNDEYRPVPSRYETYTVTLTGLDWNEDYRICVYPQTSYGVEGKPVVAKETINVGMPTLSGVRLLYDIDYSYGETKDTMGHTASISRAAKVVYDEEIGQNAVYFNEYNTNYYEFGADELEAIRDSFTFETYFKLADNTKEQDIIGLTDIAGIALEVSHGDLHVEITTDNTQEKTTSPVPVEVGEWIHIAVTFNSKEVRVYANGELVTADRYSGPLSAAFTEESASAALNLAGRRAFGTDPRLLAKGSLINSFRLYSGCLDDEDIKVVYQKTVKPNSALPFADVESGAWFGSSVRYAYEEGLMNGTSVGVFSPSVSTSRAMIVQMLYNMEGRPAVTYKPVFTDVAEGAWYADAVIWAYENGVTTGSSATTFSPDALVTREQVAVFLYRYMKDYKDAEMDAGADVSTFPDADKISPYAGFAEAISWANGVGIITGKSTGGSVTLSPLDKAQRCETATMFARFHKGFVAFS